MKGKTGSGFFSIHQPLKKKTVSKYRVTQLKEKKNTKEKNIGGQLVRSWTRDRVTLKKIDLRSVCCFTKKFLIIMLCRSL